MTSQFKGACVSIDTEIFFPQEGEKPGPREFREAVATAFCGVCVIRNQCLANAESLDFQAQIDPSLDTDYIMGGKTYQERQDDIDRELRELIEVRQAAAV